MIQVQSPNYWTTVNLDIWFVLHLLILSCIWWLVTMEGIIYTNLPNITNLIEMNQNDQVWSQLCQYLYWPRSSHHLRHQDSPSQSSSEPGFRYRNFLYPFPKCLTEFSFHGYQHLVVTTGLPWGIEIDSPLNIWLLL